VTDSAFLPTALAPFSGKDSVIGRVRLSVRPFVSTPLTRTGYGAVMRPDSFVDFGAI